MTYDYGIAAFINIIQQMESILEHITILHYMITRYNQQK
jgi:hypothetical protein